MVKIPFSAKFRVRGVDIGSASNRCKGKSAQPLSALPAKGAGRPQPPPPEHDVLRGRFRRLRFARSVGRGVAEEDGGATRCTALCRDFGSDGVAASVVRDGDRLDGRGSGGDAPAVAGARGRLVV
jgi:hypothetical protein